MREIRLDVSTDRPKPVDDALIAWADMVVPVDRAYGAELRERFPQVDRKLRLLDRDVADPAGQDLARYRTTRDELCRLLTAFVSALPWTPPISCGARERHRLDG
jgi:protein-tyrosine-phosphatase